MLTNWNLQNPLLRISTAYELDYFAQVVSKMSGCKLLYPKSATKATKVNILSKYFSDKSVWFPKHPLKKHQELESLFTLCRTVIMSSYYPKTILAASVCRITHELEFHDWRMNQNIPIRTYITPIQQSFEFFAYPEKSEKRNQIEPRTFDPTHIITNL